MNQAKPSIFFQDTSNRLTALTRCSNIHRNPLHQDLMDAIHLDFPAGLRKGLVLFRNHAVINQRKTLQCHSIQITIFTPTKCKDFLHDIGVDHPTCILHPVKQPHHMVPNLFRMQSHLILLCQQRKLIKIIFITRRIPMPHTVCLKTLEQNTPVVNAATAKANQFCIIRRIQRPHVMNRPWVYRPETFIQIFRVQHSAKSTHTSHHLHSDIYLFYQKFDNSSTKNPDLSGFQERSRPCLTPSHSPAASTI